MVNDYLHQQQMRGTSRGALCLSLSHFVLKMFVEDYDCLESIFMLAHNIQHLKTNQPNITYIINSIIIENLNF